MSLFLFILITAFLPMLCTSWAFSAVITAASCSQADVQAAINSASSGDTVRVPPGECTWTTPVNCNSAIRLLGAGTTMPGGTKIHSQLPKTLVFAVSESACNVTPLEVAGFWFVDSYETTTSLNGVVTLQSGYPGCKRFKFHDNLMTHETINSTTGSNAFFYISGDVYGVIYRNTLDNSRVGGGNAYFISLNHGSWHYPGESGTSKDIFGDGSWADVPNYASNQEKFVYVEGNLYIGPNPAAHKFFSDASAGSRIVYRYNTSINGNLSGHGFDSDNNGRGRGMRISIAYNNLLEDTVGWGTCWLIRGGTAIGYNNTIRGWMPRCIHATTFRWNQAYASGKCGDGRFYMCYQQVKTSQRACNGPMDESCDGGIGYCVGPVDDTDGDGIGPWCRDGMGRGQDNGLGTPQSSEPIFIWNNDGENAGLSITGDALRNKDYYTDETGGVSWGSGVPTSNVSCSPGYGYFDVSSRSLYRCNSNGNGWNGSGGTLANPTPYYVEYPCPHPLSGLAGRCNPAIQGVAGYPSTDSGPAVPRNLRVVQ